METNTMPRAKAWTLASRPKTLTGAAVPVMIGLALAFADEGADGFDILPATLCMLFAFIMQIDANLINDYFDYIKGTDDETRLGPKRACAMGWVSTEAMKRAIALTTTLACLTGLPLIFFGGIEMIAIGVLCVIFCFLYTTHISYIGMGDILVLVFFGIVPVTITYYIQTHQVTLEAFAASVACGLVIDTLLVINNYRDIENDRRAGKNTLVVRLGHKAGGRLYFLCGVSAFLIGSVFAINGHLLATFSPMIYMLLHYRTYRKMTKIGKGRKLNMILGETARNIFIYGILVAAALIINQ